MKKYLRKEDEKSALLFLELLESKIRYSEEEGSSDQCKEDKMLNSIENELTEIVNPFQDNTDIASEIFMTESLNHFYEIESRLIKEGCINECAMWKKDEVDLIYLINILESNNYFQSNYSNGDIICKDDIYIFFEDRYKVKLKKYQSWVWMQEVEDNEYIPWLNEYF